MKRFSHNTSREVKRIRIRLNKEFGDQQRKYQKEYEDVIFKIEDMQQKIDHVEKEIEQKAQKRQMPFMQKKMLEQQIQRAQSKKQKLLQTYKTLEEDIRQLQIQVAKKTKN